MSATPSRAALWAHLGQKNRAGGFPQHLGWCELPQATHVSTRPEINPLHVAHGWSHYAKMASEHACSRTFPPSILGRYSANGEATPLAPVVVFPQLLHLRRARVV